ncbi:MAG TPA: CapA family protein [Methylomirabilota bacterium]|nr:CapA family protein [Methylomirabilota bacterium]
MRRRPMLVVVALLGLAVVALVGSRLLGFGDAGSGSPARSAGATTAAATATPGATTTPARTGDPSASEPPASEAPAATPAPTLGPVADVAVVPVIQFRATATSVNRAEVAAVLAGSSTRYDALELVASEADAILAAVGADRPGDAARLVLADDAATLTKDLAKHRKRLAFLRADDVTPAVRALGWGGRSLFGVDRVTAAGEWKLYAQLPAAAADSAFDPGATWTMFAGGDMLFDRGVYETLRVKGKGADFPFDGGTAEITGHTCCSGFGWEQPITRRTGDGGAMRKLIKGADLALANFENPAPDRFSWHTSKTVFTADPKLIDGVVNAGIDYVSIANNHIGDAGDAGILQTIANLKERGLKYSGAGKDLAAARKPAMLDGNGTKVAVLGYDAIAKIYFAGTDETGSSQLSLLRVRNDIKNARKAGADVVIVFPHWGTEYRRMPFAGQQQLARDIIDAGADMIIGNHAHYAAAMEVYEGKPIWYALGNFVFDQTWSEPTMEGITLELTFHRKELVQVRMRPHIILDKAQPNFLDLNGDGRVVMGQIFDASKGILPW